MIDKGGKLGSREKCPYCRNGYSDLARHLKRNPRCQARSDKHDEWCQYRKRLELSFALGEMAGVIRGGPTQVTFHHTDGTICDRADGGTISRVGKLLGELAVCGHDRLIVKEKFE
jgi:hypothetical protein